MATHRMFVCLWVTKLRKTCTNRNRDWHWRFWRESQRSAGQASPHSQAARGVGSLHKAQSQATLPEGRLLNLVGGTRLKAHKLKQSGRDGSLTQLSTRGYQTLQAIRMNSLLKQPGVDRFRSSARLQHRTSSSHPKGQLTPACVHVAHQVRVPLHTRIMQVLRQTNDCT